LIPVFVQGTSAICSVLAYDYPDIRSFIPDALCLAFNRSRAADHRIEGFCLFSDCSIGLLSDALESIVNLVGALMALQCSAYPPGLPTKSIHTGTERPSIFSSGVEGTLILFAAVAIGVSATLRLLAPKPLEQIGMGLAVSVAASLVNLASPLFCSALKASSVDYSQGECQHC